MLVSIDVTNIDPLYNFIQIVCSIAEQRQLINCSIVAGPNQGIVLSGIIVFFNVRDAMFLLFYLKNKNKLGLLR